MLYLRALTHLQFLIMQKFIYLLSIVGLLLVSLLITFSCEREKLNIHNDNLRDKLLLYDYDIQKEKYSLLSEREKKVVWISKIDQILTQITNNEQRTLINKLRTLLTHSTPGTFNKSNKEILQVGLSLSAIISRSDFIQMFGVIADYKPSFLITSSCFECTEDIKKSLLEDLESSTLFTPRSSHSPCNCKWTCGFNSLAGYEVTDECRETSSG